jgi:2-iminobutanoate/2-iminopropanoate deaminase
MVFVSGQLPLNPKTRQLITGDIAAQTEQVLVNIRAILEEADATLDDVVKVTIYLKDLNQFDVVNKIYAYFFPNLETSTNLLPARSTVEVSRLPRDADIEIDCIAVISKGYMAPELY